MKKAYRFLLALGIMAALSSCTSVYMVVDEYNPADQNATITFSRENNYGVGGYRIFRWNDTAIEERLYQGEVLRHGFYQADAVLAVPAGANSFKFDLIYTYKLGNRKLSDFEIQWNLEAGKEYEVKLETKSLGFFKGDGLFIELHEKGIFFDSLLKDWRID